MGVIRQQSIWGTIITYIGAMLGFVTTGILFPKILSTEQVGLISILVAYATVFSAFASLGIYHVIGRFFPYFKNKEKKHNGFLFLVIIVPLIGFILFLIVFPLIQNFLIERSIDSSILLKNYLLYVVPLVFVILFYNVFEVYYKFLYNITLGSFLKEVLQRIVILFAVILFYYSFISFSNFINFYLLAFTSPLIIIIISLINKREFSLKPNLRYVSKSLGKLMLNMGFWGIITSLAGIVIINVDKIMIERIMGLGDAGVYTIAFFFGMLIVLPSRPLSKISSAYIAEAWKVKDMNLIKTIYIKSSINQFIIGILLLIGIWSNIHNIFQILPAEYYQGKWVILLIGLAYLTDMIIGSGPYVLINSKHYKFVTYIMIILIIATVILNLVFIPIWGLLGAAFASLLSKIIANSLYITIIHIKYKLLPFKKEHVYIVGIGIIVYFLNLILPTLSNYIIDIIFRSSIITTVFVALIYLSKSSNDINETITGIFNRIFR